MDLLQTKFYNQTKFNSSSMISNFFYNIKLSILQKKNLSVKTLFKRSEFLKLQFQKKKQSAFITALLLPFLSLFLIALIGLTGLSLGIKNINLSQSLCIQHALKTQKSLGNLLSQLLKLNKIVYSLNKARKISEASIVKATASIIFIPKVPLLKKIRDGIKLSQKLLIARQKYLLAKSFLIKKRALSQLKKKFKKLKIYQVKESTFYKKALAVKKEKIGSDAYIYRPVKDFKNHQKIKYQWEMSIFYPLQKFWFLFKKSGKYSCVSSLKKRGLKWQNILYH